MRSDEPERRNPDGADRERYSPPRLTAHGRVEKVTAGSASVTINVADILSIQTF